MSTFGIFMLTVCAIIACFLFGAGHAAAAAKAMHEEKWTDFGCNFMLAAVFTIGISIILHMRFIG